MTTETVNATPPAEYPVCISRSCAQRTHCLHARIASEVCSTARIYPLINPHHPSHQEGVTCDLYRSAEPERYARGFTQAMSELSQRNYIACTNYMIGRSSKSQFYRLKRGDLPLSPSEQEEMLDILRAYGYEGDSPFDDYEMRYTWD